MNNKYSLTALVAAATLFIAGASHAAPTPPSPTGAPTSATPAIAASLGSGKLITPHVRMWAKTLSRPGAQTTVWIYLPDPLPAGKMPCIVIAPGGSPLILGMDLSDDNHYEHLIYASVGLAVVAYSVSGGGSWDKMHVSEALSMATSFMQAHAGLSDEKAALDFAEKNVGTIDPDRIYTVGHSSAATLSLLVAEFEPRIKGCIAFAPICDINNWQNQGFINALDRQIDGYRAFLDRASPITNVAKLKCPVFIFHADDDPIALTADVDVFVNQLQKTNAHVDFVHVPTGGHFDAVVDKGLPEAMSWLADLVKKSYSNHD